MNNLGRAVISGSLAGVSAAAVLALCSRREGKDPVRPLNATSHWVHGDGAAQQTALDASHTGVGFATHQVSAVMWAYLFEYLRGRSGRNDTVATVGDALLASAVAAAVDYTITPKRFTPGWELVVSKSAMALAYAGMAAGFVASEYLLPVRNADGAGADAAAHAAKGRRVGTDPRYQNELSRTSRQHAVPVASEASAGMQDAPHPYDGAEGRPLLDLIIEGMAVVDSYGTRVGTVDKVEGGHLKITRVDQAPRNEQQYVSPDWIVAVDDRVRLNRTLDEAKRLWANEPYAKRHHIQRSI